MDTLQIAVICHEANRVYCSTIQNHSQVAWDAAPDWQKSSVILGVEKIKSGEITKPSDSHASWLQQKLAEGWKFGEIKDAAAKTHPCCVPFSELPPTQQFKDALFFCIAKMLLELTENKEAVMRELERSYPIYDPNGVASGHLVALEPVTNVNIDEITRDAYRDYGLTVGFKNFRGDPMPLFEDLPEQIKVAWKNAACAAARLPVRFNGPEQKGLLDFFEVPPPAPSSDDLDRVAADPSLAPDTIQSLKDQLEEI